MPPVPRIPGTEIWNRAQLARLSHEQLREYAAMVGQQKDGQLSFKLIFIRRHADHFGAVQAVAPNAKVPAHMGELLFVETPSMAFVLKTARGTGSRDAIELFRRQPGLQFSIDAHLQHFRRFQPMRSTREMERVSKQTFIDWRNEAYPVEATRPKAAKFIISYNFNRNQFFGVKALPSNADLSKLADETGLIYVKENPDETFLVEDMKGRRASDLANNWHQRGIIGVTINGVALAARQKTERRSYQQTLERLSSPEQLWQEAYGHKKDPNKPQKYVVQIYQPNDGDYYTVRAFAADNPAIQHNQSYMRITLERKPGGHHAVLAGAGRGAAKLIHDWKHQPLNNITFDREALAKATHKPSSSAERMHTLSQHELGDLFSKHYRQEIKVGEEIVLQFRLTHSGKYNNLAVLRPNDPQIKPGVGYGKIFFTQTESGLKYLRHSGLGSYDIVQSWFQSTPAGILLPSKPEDVPYKSAPKRKVTGFATTAILSDVILAPITLPAKLSWHAARTAVTHPFFRESAGFVAADSLAKLITGHSDEIDMKKSAQMMAVDTAIRTIVPSNYSSLVTMAMMDYAASGKIHPQAYAENIPLMGLGNMFGKTVSAWLAESFAFAKFAGSFASFTTFFILADFKQRYEQAEDLAISTAQLANSLKSSTPEQSKLQLYIQQRLFSSSAGSQLGALLEKIANATEKPDEALENMLAERVQHLIKRPSCHPFAQLKKIAEQKKKLEQLRNIYLEAATTRAAELQKEIDEFVKNALDKTEGKLYQPLIRIELENALDQFKLACLKKFSDLSDAPQAELTLSFSQLQRQHAFAQQLHAYEAQLTQEQQDQLRLIHYDCEHEQLHPLCQMQNSGKFLREDIAGVEAIDWSQQSYTTQESPPEDLSVLKAMSLADALLFMKYRGVELYPTAPQTWPAHQVLLSLQ